MDIKKILIVDDHPLFLDGLQSILESIIEGLVCLRANNSKHASEMLVEDVDCIFLDHFLPDMSGLDLIRNLRSSSIFTPIIMLSAINDVEFVRESVLSGANGFISKNAEKKDYLACLSAIEEGEDYFQESIAKQLTILEKVHRSEAEHVLSQLSERQKEILPMLAAGYSNKEIGQALGLALSTTKNYITEIINLMNCDNRTHCAVEARRIGLLAVLKNVS